MPFPTNEQRAILESNDRLVIVEAAPGSGKTHLFIEFMKLNLTRFVDPRSGIAALSFTNAARDEIQTRLGLVLDSNHFIGTLDAFMYRFVVKPFAPALGLHEHGVRLLAAPLDEEQRSFQVQHGPTARNQASLFSIKFVDGSIAAPVMHVRDRGAYGRPHLVHAEREAPVLRRKHEMWTSHGLITHSDCAYIAAKILSDSVLGPQVIEILSRRFPMILVDEVQDTGRFLSVALTKLLESDRVESLVVGDPDQSIYGFSGANPNLFNELRTIPGAVVYPLTQTQRCSQGICDAASHLSATGRQIVPDADVQPGRQILLVHRQ
ncbi:MAG: ATP-dependent helicase, partial [Bdellovibrionaceae bacterium]|nr:ATP-dependent helicase [Pseudobdellovibrionaceae bacterium]